MCCAMHGPFASLHRSSVMTAAKTLWPQRWTPAVVSLGTSEPGGDRALQREAFLGRFPALRRRRFFLFLSRIHRKKGCDLLLEAFGRVARAYPDLDLVMAGPDEGACGPSWRRKRSGWGSQARVHWTGMLEGDLKWGAFLRRRSVCASFAPGELRHRRGRSFGL